MKKLWLLCLLACVGFAPVNAVKETDASGPVVGDTPPDYLGKDLEGNVIKLSEFPGRVRVVSFWATWCAPCLQELPILERLQSEVSKDHLMVIAVNFEEGKRAARRLARALEDPEMTITYDWRDKASKSYGVNSVPRLYIIDKYGKIAHVHIGYGEGMVPGLVEEINELLRQLAHASMPLSLAEE